MPEPAPVNADTRIARAYHEQTNHSYRSVRAPGRGLDWANRPLPYKIYETLDPIPLPPAGPLVMPAADAVASDGIGGPASALTLDALAQVLYFSNGVTRERRRGGGAVEFRAASCTGQVLLPTCRRQERAVPDGGRAPAPTARSAAVLLG